VALRGRGNVKRPKALIEKHPKAACLIILLGGLAFVVTVLIIGILQG
jgi:hypothetical protein